MSMNPLIAKQAEKVAGLKAVLDGFDNQVIERGEELDATDQATYEATEAEYSKALDYLNKLQERERRQAESYKVAADLGNAGPAFHKTIDEPIYHERSGESFFFDAAKRFNDVKAYDRIMRHSEFEERSVKTSDLGDGLVVPQYLVNEFAGNLRNSRAFANAVRQEVIPTTGMSLVIGKATQGTTVASQNTENSAVSEQDFNADEITIPVVTKAGTQKISFQSRDRGLGVDRIIYQDLVSAYNADVESYLVGVLNGAAEASPTPDVPVITEDADDWNEFWSLVWEARAEIARSRKVQPTHLLLGTTRWAWLGAQRDSLGRPLLTAIAPSNAPGSWTANELGGLTVVSSGEYDGMNAATPTKDYFAVYNRDDVILWEESQAPRRVDINVVSTLTAEVTVYGYVAATVERYPEGICVVKNTSLPDFDVTTPGGGGGGS